MTATFKGWHMAAITGSFLAVIVGVNITMAALASSSWTGLVVKNSYVASQNFNRDLAAAREQRALGWQIELDVKSGFARVSIHDRDGAPLRGLEVRAVFARPVSEAQDRSLRLAEISSGIYSSQTQMETGVWNVDIVAEGSGRMPVRVMKRVVVN